MTLQRFDHLRIPLAGQNLIEASAGTGKTYAIACLYLRLVLEQGMTPEQILVVTFTEAATKELRSRVRERLREGLELFRGGETKDPFLLGLAENANGLGPDRERGARLLADAITCFDQAAIQTIHGFCLRALQDNAFESGSRYDTELLTDQRPLLREIADDFWRREFFGPSAPLLGQALEHRLSADGLAAFLGRVVSSPRLRLLPEFSAGETAALDAEGVSSLGALRESWHGCRDEVVEILYTHKGIRRSVDTYRDDIVAPLPRAMDRFVAGDGPWNLFDGFEKFCTGFMRENRKQKPDPPEHRFFDLCESHRQLAGRRLLALKSGLVAFARVELPRRKTRLGIRCFDDLLNDLYLALEKEGGDRLAGGIRSRYRAALVDEFQDTDPVQYRIFHRIFAAGDAPLFFIGDPKQAIYGFRGADVFAYLEAAAEVPAADRHTLDANWRSDHRLLSAVNGLFGRKGAPFVFPEIAYHPVRAGKYREGEPLTLAGGAGAPFKFWFVQGGDGGVMDAGTADRELPRATAGEIARLLHEGGEGRALVEGRPLRPGDIAVIVRTHLQAGYVHEALRAFGIPAVLQGTGNLFETREAVEIQTLLHALADPAAEGYVRAALATDMLGLSGGEIHALLDDEAGWERELERFRQYRDLWLERGVMAMARTLVDGEGVRGRLLAREDGERRLTNILHCFELLHQAETEGRLGLERLPVWLGERIAGREEREEYQMRLETDAAAVKVVTVHVSKGLEYPVVFCPFAWKGLREPGELVTFHDGFELVTDYGSPEIEEHRARARTEALAEELRLLYVALTRAKFRCYLVWGRLKNAGSSAPAWLLHAGAAAGTPDPVTAAAAAFGALSAEEQRTELEALAAVTPGCIDVAELPSADGAPVYRTDDATVEEYLVRTADRSFGHEWRVASFTSFVAGHHRHAELPDRDEVTVAPLPADATPPDPDGIFAFPRGARAGVFLHELFEKLDFSNAAPEQLDALVADGLARYGYAPRWQRAICGMLNEVVRSELDTTAGFALERLLPGSWRAELEFFFPLRFLESPQLAGLFARWGGRGLPYDPCAIAERLEFLPAEGFVRGFMDLVCCHEGRWYLLDWKSNHLGNGVEAYGPAGLATEMVRSLYPLQYLLYTVALDRYLRLRIPDYDYDRHFGGVRYLFLRGVNTAAGPAYGIFSDRPDRALVAELADLLLASGGTHG